MSDLHSIEIEQSLIGSILLQNNLFSLVDDKIKSGDFFEGIHSELWDICGSLIRMGKRANPLTVTAFLPADLKIGEMNAKQYVARLAAAGAIPNEVVQLAETVRDLSDCRRMQALFQEGLEVLGSPSPDPDLIAGGAFDALDAITTARTVQDSPSLSLGQSVVRSVDASAKAYQNDGTLSGLSYGLRDLDTKTGGLHKGELTLLAGRPGMMKSGVALNFARSLCSETVDDQGVVRSAAKGMFFSLEMGDVLLTQRLMSDMIFSRGHEVPYSRIRRGAISEIEFGYITTAGTTLAKLPLLIEQRGGIGLSEIGSKARRLKRTSGLDFVIVDYLQLMGVADRYRGNRVNEVSELSLGLLKIAKDLDIAMIALCQLNRGVESREDKRPGLADLRESGSLEQDASVVMMLYREAYYLQNKEPRAGTPEYETWQNNMVRCINVLKIQIEKNRNGPTGEIECYVNPAVNAVRDLTDQSMPYQEGTSF